MISTRRVVARLSVVAFGLGLLVVAAPRASAQLTTSNPKWQAWIGCWQPDDAVSAYGAPIGPVVCVVPAAAISAVDIVTVDSGKIVSRYTVDASGQEKAVNRDGCTGWEKARWSNDNLRVFLSSDLTCGAIKRTSTGVMSISPNGQWVTVDAVKAGGNEAVRATHARYIDAPALIPQDIAVAATLGARMDRRAAAIAAGTQMTPAMIVEAMHALDTAAVQAWLVERHESFSLTAQTLITLADAGVPGSVTDVMVAANYPEEFHFSRGAAPPAMSLSPRDSARIANDYLLGRSSCDPLSYYSPYTWGVNPCSPYYNSYSYGYGYPGRYGYGYGYSPYGYGNGYGYNAGYYSGIYTGPVVIISNGGGDTHGRAVKGQGYTRGSGSSSGSGSSGSAPSSASGSSSAGSSSGSSSGSSAGSSSGSSSGRTAIPRPPT